MMNDSRWARWWPPLISFVIIVIAAEIIIRMSHVSAYLLPPPSAVVRAIFQHGESLFQAMWWTTVAAVGGFAAAAVIGVVLGVILASKRWVRRAFYPYAIFFQTVPIVAIAPLLVIWVGYGLRSIVAAAFIVAVFPVIAGTLTGLMSADPALRDLFKLYGGSRWDVLTKLRIPSALPNLFTGLRVAAGLAVVGTLVGEFISSYGSRAGLGIMIMSAMKQSETALVFAAIVLASVLGLVMFALVNWLSYMLLHRWHASEQM